VSTDYAVGFGRDRYCARVPLDREKMTRIVDYLNGLNVPYRDGKKEFEWDVLRNNCSHVAHNALAAAGVWDEWPTGQFLLLAALDFPVPKNEFVNLMRRTNDFPVQDISAIYEDAAARNALTQMASLPTEPGALAEAEPAVQQNEVYDSPTSLIFYDDPIFGSYQRRFDRIVSEARYLDLRANLLHFAALYGKIADAHPPLGAFLDETGDTNAARRDELALFYARYYAYIERQRAAVGAELAALPRSRASVSLPALNGRSVEAR
jgi:hypothetical protein